MMVKSKDEADGKGVKVTLVPTEGKVSNRVYANYVQIQNTPFDISIRFCDALPLYDKPQTHDVRLDVPIVAEIVLPYDVVPNFIKALEEKYKHYLIAQEKTHGTKGKRKANP